MQRFPAPLSLCRMFSLYCGVAGASLSATTAAKLSDACKPPAVLASAIASTPSAKVYDAAGAWFAEQGKLKCAVAAFEAAVRLEPGSAEAHYNLGVARVHLNELPAASSEFRLALKANTDMLPARNSLGAVLTELGHSDEAKLEFEHALKIDPNSVFALDYLAQLLASGRHYKLAIQYWNLLAVIEKQAGHFDKAIGLLQTVVKLQPRNGTAWYSLGQSLEHESQTEQAISAWKPSDPDIERALLLVAKTKTQRVQTQSGKAR